jgi:hypothetical protein
MAFNYLALAHGAALHHPEKAVLAVLCNHINKEEGTGKWMIPIYKIALEAGIGERTVGSALRQLKALGLISWTRAFDGASTYKVHLDKLKAFPTVKQLLLGAFPQLLPEGVATIARLSCIYCGTGLAHIAGRSGNSCQLNGVSSGFVTGPVQQEHKQQGVVVCAATQLQPEVERKLQTPAPPAEAAPFDPTTFNQPITAKDGKIYPAEVVRRCLDFHWERKNDYWRGDEHGVFTLASLKRALPEMLKQVPPGYKKGGIKEQERKAKQSPGSARLASCLTDPDIIREMCEKDRRENPDSYI